jgi:uncharacterized membrane protein
MITSALIIFASSIVYLLLQVFPTSQGIPAEYNTALTTLSGYVGIFEPILPISTLIDTLNIVLLFEITVFFYTSLAWVYHKIPFIGK